MQNWSRHCNGLGSRLWQESFTWVMCRCPETCNMQQRQKSPRSYFVRLHMWSDVTIICWTAACPAQCASGSLFICQLRFCMDDVFDDAAGS